jgi:hypothetical protein
VADEPPYHELIEGYCRFLRHDRGLAETTVVNYRRYLRDFLVSRGDAVRPNELVSSVPTTCLASAASAERTWATPRGTTWRRPSRASIDGWTCGATEGRTWSAQCRSDGDIASPMFRALCPGTRCRLCWARSVLDVHAHRRLIHNLLIILPVRVNDPAARQFSLRPPKRHLNDSA